MKISRMLLLLATLLAKSTPALSNDQPPPAKPDGEIEVSIPAYITGGVLGTTVGFGIGHAVQGRYKQKGWIFTALELGSVGLIIVGDANCWPRERSGDDGDSFDDWDFPRRSHSLASSCPGAPAILAGIGGLMGFHIWEIVDVWSAPKFDSGRKKFYAKNGGTLNIGFTALPRGQAAVPALAAQWTY